MNFYHKSFPLPGVLSVPGVPELVVLLLHSGGTGAWGGAGGGGHHVLPLKLIALKKSTDVQKSHIGKYIHADIADIHASPSWTPDLRQKQAHRHTTHYSTARNNNQNITSEELYRVSCHFI